VKDSGAQSRSGCHPHSSLARVEAAESAFVVYGADAGQIEWRSLAMQRSRDAADSDLSRGDADHRRDSLARRAAGRFVELRLSPGRTDASRKRHGAATERWFAGAVQCGGWNVLLRTDAGIVACARLRVAPNHSGTVAAGQ